MRISVNNNIRIERPTSAIMSWCKEHLVLDNPDFYKKEQMGFSTYNIPRTIQLYEKVGDEIWLPFGCLRDIWKMVAQSCPWSVQIAPLRHLTYGSRISLYSYQEKAVEAALKAKNGVLVMPCGSGKTQCGLEIIARLGGRALWLTHTQDLLNQSKKRAESILISDINHTSVAFGTITAGKVDVGTHITFATVQTMSKIDLSQYRDYWDVIIVDEAQHCAGSPTRVTQFYKVVSSLSARYKIGLTATPKRADGLQAAMFAILGGKIHEVTRGEVAHTTCLVKVQTVETGWCPDYGAVLMGDGTIDYNKVIDNMTHSEERMACVFGEIMIYLYYRKPMMVLANRVEYLQTLCDKVTMSGTYRAVCLSGKGQSKKAKAERKEALEKLNNGELDCIFATYQLAKEGLDVPNLRYVVLATPEQDETTVVQSVGRVGRKADGKDFGTVIDFVDAFGMYQGWAKKRMRYYKKIEAEVME